MKNSKAYLRRAWESVKVASCADGSLKIVPEWKGARKYTPEDGGGPGLLNRLGAAEALEQELNAMLRLKKFAP